MDFSQHIWIEKYTPKSIDDLCIPEHCVENDTVEDFENKIFLADKRIIQNIVDKPLEMQNMLFFSESPGTGKTSTFELIGKLVNTRTKYINASLFDDKATIEREIISFSQYNNFKSEKVPKLIILDEIDGAKAKAFQEPLKATIPAISKTARVCMAANDIDAIIPPLRSRAIKIDFSHSHGNYVKEIKNKMVKRLEWICTQEGVKYDTSCLVSLVESNYPDFRTALDNAQLIAKVSGKITGTTSTGKQFSYQGVVDALMVGNYQLARTEHLKLQPNNGIFLILLRWFDSQNIDPLKKLQIVSVIGNANNYHNECASKEVNIAHMFAQICQVTK